MKRIFLVALAFVACLTRHWFLDLKPAGRATHAKPALAAPLVPTPRLAQGWWAEQCGTARLVWRSAPGSRLRRAPSRRPDQPRFGLLGLDGIVVASTGSQPLVLTSFA